MATSSTNRTVLYLAVGGVLVFLAWKLWPALSKKIGGGSSGGGSTTASGGYPPYPSSSSPSSPFGSGSANFGASPQTAPGQPGGGLAALWANLVGAGTYAGSSIAQQNYIDNLPGNELQEQIDANTNWTPEIENLGNLPSYSADDPNAPWNAGSDVGSYDDSGGAGDYDYSGDMDGGDGGDDGGGGGDTDYGSGEPPGY